MTTINVAAPKAKRELTIEINIPKDLPGMVKLFGEEKVASAAFDAFVISCQGFYRSRLAKSGEDRMSDADIRKAVWSPGNRTIDPVKRMAKLAEAVSKLTPEQRTELLKAASVTPALKAQAKK